MRAVARIKIPAGHAVDGDVDAIGRDQATDGALDAAIRMAMDPEILQQDVMRVDVRADAVGVVIVNGLGIALAIVWVKRAAVHGTGGVRGDVQALDVDVLGAAQVQCGIRAIAAEDLRHLAGGRLVAGAAGRVVAAEDAGMLRGGACGNGGVDAGKGAVAAEAPGVVVGQVLIEANAPLLGVVEDDGVATRDNPLGDPVGVLVIPEEAIVVEGAVLVDTLAGVGRIGLAVALAVGGVCGVAGAAIGANIPRRSGSSLGHQEDQDEREQEKDTLH